MADILAKDSGIYIAGHQGFVGSSVLRMFIMKRFSDIILKTCQEVDLTQSLMDTFRVIKV
jgi:GDP-L-fucose synthase